MKKVIEEVKTCPQGGIEINGEYYDESSPYLREILDLIRKIENDGRKLESQPLIRKEEPKDCLTAYFERWAHKRDAPALVSTNVVIWSWIGSFLGIALLCYIHYEICLAYTQNLIFIVGSFGAQAVLLFAAPKAPLAQPWNAVVGNGVSAFAGICAWHLVGDGGIMWLAGALAVSIAIVFMHWTNSLHPPGGATALIAVMEMNRVHELSFLYILFPAVFASMAHVAVALFVNNLSSDKLRSYPMTWKPFKWM
mmetsp:Transcript_26948/g.37488  ORF Transcript_26948/g.37488 Transcript_26948/m.37488 type:complete len:252 (+) Transcript_26948:215-970(+)